MHEIERPLSFWERARRAPEGLALVAPDEREWAAGEVLRRCDAIAARLRALGHRDGDAVAVAATNHPDALIVALAVTQIGGYFVPISSRSTASEIGYVLDNCGARFLLAETDVLERTPNAGGSDEYIAVGLGAGLDEWIEGTPSDVSFERRCGQIMPYTSGTTGRPKGVRRPLPDVDPDEYWATSSRSSFDTLRLRHGDDDVHLVVSPLYHTAIINLATAALHLGQTVVVRERFEPLDVLRTIERRRVTTAHMVPTQFHRLLSLDPSVRGAHDLSSVRTLLHGAAPCPVVVKRRMIEWLGPVISEYYGASEGGGTFVTAEEWNERPGTVGRPYSDAEVHILDDEGAALPAGMVGRVFLKPPGQLFEYHGDPDKTAASRSGSLITAGDLGYLDEAGYLFLSGRASDLVITGGVNVYPAEVEDALFSHPSVADACVVGLPDDEWGEIVTAVVELRDGWEPSASTSDAIVAHCAGILARHKLPKRIEFVLELPREPNGKIRKPQLVERYRDLSGAE